MTEQDRAAARRYSGNVRVELARARRTQTEIAAVIGMSWPSWQRRMSGRVAWRVSELEALARALGVELTALTGGDA